MIDRAVTDEIMSLTDEELEARLIEVRSMRGDRFSVDGRITDCLIQMIEVQLRKRRAMQNESKETV